MDALHLLTPLQWLPAFLIVAAALALTAVCAKYRKGTGDYLCDDCRFNADDLCRKDGRPHVFQCTSYRQGPVKIVAAPSVEDDQT